ncbi:MAG: hypothetical protein HY898_28825 [Deltaproteobacteria bacterium]|nr:hypothetical protein [Deltaproteobacteria bacterium]
MHFARSPLAAWIALATCACSSSGAAPPAEVATPDAASVDSSDGAPADTSIEAPKEAQAEAADEPTPPEPLCGFQVTITDGAKLTVRAPGGRALLEGLAPKAISGDAPPNVGFAVRDQTTDYQMMFGSFKPTVTTHGPWRVAAKLTEQSLPDGKRVDFADDLGTVLGQLTFRCPESGHLKVDIASGQGPEHHFSWGFGCNAEDHFAGFGAQTWDVDHRKQTVPTWVQEEGIGKIETDTYDDLLWYLGGRRHSSHLPIPQYLSRRGYILTTETQGRSIFALCSEQDDAARVEVDLPVAIHLFDGPAPAQAIERATATFGRPRMPPRLAFAPWLDAIYGTSSVLAIAQKARDAQIPASVIWTEDWRGGHASMTGYDLNEEWEVDPTLYPDMGAMTSQLHDSGYAFFVYFNPFIFQGSKAWDEVEPKGWLIKNGNGDPYTFQGASVVSTTSMLDITHPGARAWAVGKMKAAIALGADGWMADFAEWLPTDAVLHGGKGIDLHNHYPVVWQELSREAIDSVNDGEPRMFFARSGWFGTPALADSIWAGDQRTDMQRDDGLPVIIPIGIGLGLVGVSTYGHDIAGYNSTMNAAATKEVFFRWTELGAWSPVMRTHHGNAPDKNWSWGKDSETTAHFRRYAQLHMALVPYWEGLAKIASTTGMPIWRGMALQFPEDAAVWPIDDQVMVGDGVIVAPVQKPGESSRSVYLPKGLWYTWEGEDAIGGPAKANADAPVGEIPVYARGGAVVPMYPESVLTVFHESQGVPGPTAAGDDRVVQAFLGDDGEFVEASGLRYAIEQVEATWYGELGFRWQGQGLGACAAVPQAPCVTATPHLGVLTVEGPGVAEVMSGAAVVARVRIEGGDAKRKLTVRIRH